MSIEFPVERPVRFILNGAPVEVAGFEPTTTLLTWLRTERRLVGTKEGCAEGDCGACTVVVGQRCEGGHVHLRSRNACIQFVPMLDGQAVYTVESVQGPQGALHPVQQAMVEHHASQCGFCTPGFVMSLWDLYNTHLNAGTRPDRAQVQSALTGNLCRCTGYRPILDAAQAMFDLPAQGFDHAGLAGALGALNASQEGKGWVYTHEGVRFMAPHTLDELLEWRTAHPEATVLAGATDIGLWVNKQFRDLGDLLYIGRVPEIARVEDLGDTLDIGAGVSLTDAYAALCVHHPELAEMAERFASTPIRNAGTLGGNIANGSPIGDSMPALIALGADVVVGSARGRRTLPLEALYLDYMKKDLAPDELVLSLRVPKRQAQSAGVKDTHRTVFRTYKISKRFDSDISAVCAAFTLELAGDRIVGARAAFGGMAATPRRAAATELALSGAAWSETTMQAARDALAQDFTPLSDMRASAGYRLLVAQNLLQRFYLETRLLDPLPATQTRAIAWAG